MAKHKINKKKETKKLITIRSIRWVTKQYREKHLHNKQALSLEQKTEEKWIMRQVNLIVRDEMTLKERELSVDIINQYWL